MQSKLTKKVCFAIFGLFLLAQNSFAQNNIPYTAIYYSPDVGSFYYSGGIGSSRYIGDLGSMFGETKTHFLFKGLQYNLNVGYQLTNYISLRADVNWYKHTSNDYANTDSTARFTQFTAGRNRDISLNIVHELIPKAEIDAGHKRYSPYVMAGIGITNHKGTLSYDTTVALDTTSFPLLAAQEKEIGKPGVIIPFGAGIRYYLMQNLHLAFEVRAAVDLSDMVDFVSNRVDPNTKDKYILYGFKLVWSRNYRFNYKRYKRKNYQGL